MCPCIQVFFVSAVTNGTVAVESGGAEALDVTVRVAPFGSQKFIPGITAEVRAVVFALLL